MCSTLYTGTGKTHTVFGPEFGLGEPDGHGIVPRACGQLFDELAANKSIVEVAVKVSFQEIYKEIIRDLLRDPAKKPLHLKLQQSAEKGIYTQGLIERFVYAPEDIMNLVRVANKARGVGKTKLNERSSRSHAILTVTVTATMKDGSINSDRLVFVDLAGSENIRQSEATGEQVQEASKINRSLRALAHVCLSLSEGAEHVPYRDAKLTYLLQDSLGGNTKTILVSTCSPHQSAFQETLSTLRFATRAKKVMNAPRVNKTESATTLKALVAYLEDQLADQQAAMQETQVVLDLIGVERDDKGQFLIPKELKAVGDGEGMSSGEARVREMRLERQLATAKKKAKKTDKKYKREVQYNKQLKAMFTKQKEIATQLKIKLRKRDQTILFLTKELDEHQQFQDSLQDAVDSGLSIDPAILAQNMQGGSAHQDYAQYARKAAMDDSASEYDSDISEEPQSPVRSERSFREPQYQSRSFADLRKAKQAYDSDEEVDDDEDDDDEDDDDEDDDDEDAEPVVIDERSAVVVAEPQRVITDEAKQQQQKLDEYKSQRQREIRNYYQSVRVLESAGTFLKYPYLGGFMAKPTKKQLFYDKDTHKVFYWDDGTKISRDSKFVLITHITDLYVGKRTPAFQKSAAKNAAEERCFSFKCDGRTIDLEADSAQVRDAWVVAINLVARAERRKKKNKHASNHPFEVHGELPDADTALFPSTRRLNQATRTTGFEEKNLAQPVRSSRPAAAAAAGGGGQQPDPGPQVSEEEVMAEGKTAKKDAAEIMSKVQKLKKDPLGEKEQGQQQQQKKKKEKKKAPKQQQKQQQEEEDGGDGDGGSGAPFQVRAKYKFNAKSKLQLSFKKGDVLTVLNPKKGGWWTAQLGDDVGSIVI